MMYSVLGISFIIRRFPNFNCELINKLPKSRNRNA